MNNIYLLGVLILGATKTALSFFLFLVQKISAGANMLSIIGRHQTLFPWQHLLTFISTFTVYTRVANLPCFQVH